LKAWHKLGGFVNGEFDRVMAALAAFKSSGQWSDPKFIPHPATWLNKRRFDDELEQTAPRKVAL
jgi:hypothetical protein